MTSLFDGYNYIIRLAKDEHLREGLEAFFAQNTLDGGWLSGIGGVQSIELGFYDLHHQQYHWQTTQQLLEMTNLQGTIAKNEQGELVTHLHGTFADSEYRTIGGHVKDFVVGGTCELFIHRTFQPLYRAHDQATGLDLLKL